MAKTQNTDPRVKPVAEYLCYILDDDWRIGRRFWTKQAKAVLIIADCAKVNSKKKERK